MENNNSGNGNREMGVLTTTVKMLVKQFEDSKKETHDNFGRVFTKLDNISLTAERHSMGVESNRERIVKLEERPGKNMAMLAGVASVLATIISVLAFWKH